MSDQLVIVMGKWLFCLSAATNAVDLPVVLCRVDEIINLGVDDLENSLFRSFLVVSEFFGSNKCDRTPSRGGRPRSDQELFQLLTGGFEMLKVNENLHNLPQVL